MGRSALLSSKFAATSMVVLLGSIVAIGWWVMWAFNGDGLGDRWVELGIGQATVVTDGIAPVGAIGLGPQIQESRYSEVTLKVSDISDAAVLWFRTAVITTLISMGLASVTFLVLCYRAVRGIPFGRLTSWLTTSSGLLLFLGGFLSASANAWGTYETINGVSGIHDARPRIFTGGPMYYFPSTFDPVPVVLGLVFLLLAVVLSRGTAHYRDVKDLV